MCVMSYHKAGYTFDRIKAWEYRRKQVLWYGIHPHLLNRRKVKTLDNPWWVAHLKFHMNKTAVTCKGVQGLFLNLFIQRWTCDIGRTLSFNCGQINVSFMANNLKFVSNDFTVHSKHDYLCKQNYEKLESFVIFTYISMRNCLKKHSAAISLSSYLIWFPTISAYSSWCAIIFE